MRIFNRRRVSGAILLAGMLALAACGEGSGGDATTSLPSGDTTATTQGSSDTTSSSETTTGGSDDPVITVGSFNFPESVILAEIYGQALEANGYPVERNLNLGSRELIFPELQSEAIDLLPEYLGSAIAVGFGEESPTDTAGAVTTLEGLFAESGVRVLEPAPGQDKNVFVVTGDFASANGVS